MTTVHNQDNLAAENLNAKVQSVSSNYRQQVTSKIYV